MAAGSLPEPVDSHSEDSLPAAVGSRLVAVGIQPGAVGSRLPVVGIQLTAVGIQSGAEGNRRVVEESTAAGWGRMHRPSYQMSANATAVEPPPSWSLPS